MMGQTTFANLLDLLVYRCSQGNAAPNQAFFCSDARGFEKVSYSRILSRAFGLGKTLWDMGVRPQHPCLIVAVDTEVTLVAFYAAVSMGAWPMILSVPKAFAGCESVLAKAENWARHPRRRVALIWQSEAGLDGPDWGKRDGFASLALSKADLASVESCDTPVRRDRPAPDEVAYLQSTSASTGRAKSICITHRNVLDNTMGIRIASDCSPEERTCSWLPLYHDMGLVGAELFSLHHGYDMVSMRPFEFLKRPKRWLRGISDYRCSVSPAPNFAYEYTADRVTDDAMRGLDLSSWRVAFNGAEPLRARSMEKFCQRFEPVGFRATTLRPCYGLAESTLAVTICSGNAKPRYLTLRGSSVAVGERVSVEASGTLGDPRGCDPDAVAVFSVGKPILGTQIAVCDERGRVIPGERVLGEIVVSGPSLAGGYLRDDEGESGFTSQLRTGDLGFLQGGELYVLDRLKSLIIVNGENHSASLLESQLANVLQISDERVAIFESDLLANDREVVAIVELTGGADEAESLILRLAGAGKTEVPLARVIFARQRTIPRTTSGKKQHFLCRSQLARGQLPWLVSIEPRVDAPPARRYGRSAAT